MRMSDKLREWLRLNNMTPGDLTLKLFGNRDNRMMVHRYLKGRVPTPEIMARIISLTEGYVQPNDFYKSHTTELENKPPDNNTRKRKNETVADISKPARKLGAVVRRGTKR
jgi:hypothetical protein